MKYINMPHILKANALMSQLDAIDDSAGIEIEAYSCKPTRMQKAHRRISKPLRFFITALEEAFDDYDFSAEPLDAFATTTYAAIKDDVSFVFFTKYKNCGDVDETMALFDELLRECVDLRASKLYAIDMPLGEAGEKFKVYLIHDAKQKRVLLIKLATRLVHEQ
ncbi:hypothetical protein PAPHI01_1276 [Pancytospora philotis]|nr:hypothetical protein PAPHI01_1276 [Pancytospora philotis]